MKGLTEEDKRDQSYWICKKKTGIIPQFIN